MFAPEIDNMIALLRQYPCDLGSQEQLRLKEELFNLMDSIKPTGLDERRDLWIKADRGTLADCGDVEELADNWGIASREEVIEVWEQEYPDPVVWYRLTTMRHGAYFAVFLGQEHIFESGNVLPSRRLPDAQVLPLLNWLLGAVTDALAMVRAGTYNEDVAKNLPLKHRTGMIRRSDWWERVPDARKHDCEYLDEAAIHEFLSVARKADCSHEPQRRLPQMTAGMFFDACALGYTACDYTTEGLSSVEQYLKFADTRDEGLSQIDRDDPGAFDEWYHNRTDRYGHPWEVCRGGALTHLNLFVVDDESGYYFMLEGNNRRGEAVRFFLALREAGLPVMLLHGDQIADALAGKDYVGIVPEGFVPNYCSSLFPGKNLLDYVRLSDLKMDGHDDCVLWLPETKIISSDARY